MELNLAKIVTHHASRVTHHASRVTRHASPATHPPIRNIIFDFGGVICNIDVKLTEKAFIDLGLKTTGTGSDIPGSAGLFGRLETGQITPQQFRDELRKHFGHPVTDEQLDKAWNALLLDIPEQRIRLLEAIRKNYRIFLLSNTNEIHYNCFVNSFRDKYGYADFDALFGKSYFSYRLGIKKPSPEIFRHVLYDSRLEPSETLFIDDTLMHVEAAEKEGIRGYRLAFEQGEQIVSLFR